MQPIQLCDQPHKEADSNKKMQNLISQRITKEMLTLQTTPSHHLKSDTYLNNIKKHKIKEQQQQN